MDNVTSDKILKQAILQQAELDEDSQGSNQKLVFTLRFTELQIFVRKGQKKIVELNTGDSSDEENSDSDGSIGNMEFPDCVS